MKLKNELMLFDEIKKILLEKQIKWTGKPKKPGGMKSEGLKQILKME